MQATGRSGIARARVNRLLDALGDVEHPQICLPHLALGPCLDPPVDAREQALTGFVVDCAMTGVSVEHGDVFVGGVDHVPEVASRADVAEPAAPGDLVA